MMKSMLVLPLMLMPTTALAGTASGGDLQYRVQPGDTLIGLAERGLRRLPDYRVVQRRNRIADPRMLRAGSILAIPRSLLRIEEIPARVVALRGEVTLNGQPARINMAVGPGETIRSGKVSFLTMRIVDGSLLTVPSNSRLDIVELRRIVLTGTVEKRFRLQNGRVETDVQPLKKKGDRFEIQTPAVVASVRGTHYRVSYQQDTGLSGVGVVDGIVAVDGARREELVKAGNGITASPDALGAARPLLPAPEIPDSETMQDGALVSLHPRPVPGAAAYRAQLATDAGFVDLFAENEATTPAIEISDVPDGSFFVRLTAISAGGLEGLPVSYTMERRRNDITSSVGEVSDCPARRCLRFRWQNNGEGPRRYRFQLLPSPEGIPVIDQPGMTDAEMVVTDLPAGTYYWRVQSLEVPPHDDAGGWSPLMELHVAALKK